MVLKSHRPMVMVREEFESMLGGASADPVIFLRGDVVEKRSTVVAVISSYRQTTAYDEQAKAEQLCASFNRPYIHLARPGILGSSGYHLDRRRPREVALVDMALTRLKANFGWHRLNLVGQSGGGHLVAALIARRGDFGCAVITSGNTEVEQRNRMNGRATDITGHADFFDPIDHVAQVARHPPETIIVLTDPCDKIVSASVQTAYVEALRGVGVPVDHRLLPATGKQRHDLQLQECWRPLLGSRTKAENSRQKHQMLDDFSQTTPRGCGPIRFGTRIKNKNLAEPHNAPGKARYLRTKPPRGSGRLLR